MYNEVKLKEALSQYKQDFISKQWVKEKYKWEAVKWFKDHWNVDALDFAAMLNRSLDKTFNLLASNNHFPRKMITGFAKVAPEEVRAMFIALFDETKDVYERVNAFKQQSAVLLEKYGNGAAQHYQHENAISTYLWLRYPEKYYISSNMSPASSFLTVSATLRTLAFKVLFPNAISISSPTFIS